MADKSFGVKQINLIGASGTPTIESPNNVNLNAINVAISTDVTIGGQVQSNLKIGSSYSVGIGTTNPTSKLHVVGNALVTGVSTFTGAVSFGTSAYFGDNDKLYFGDSNDLEIYHNGSNSVITDVGTGVLVLGGSSAVQITNSALSEISARFLTDGSAELYYDNVKTFETTGYGATVFGILQSQGLQVSGVSTFNNTLNVVPASTSIAGLFSGTTSSDMVRITQTGSGNALVVEDETNPDSTPFVVTGTGRVGIGITNPSSNLQLIGTLTIGSGGLQITSTELFRPNTDFIMRGGGNQSTRNSINLTNGLGIVIDGGSGETYGVELKGGGGPVKVTQGNLLVGTATSTGTTSQPLQVTGGAYVSGSVGIGTTNPTSKLHVVGDTLVTGVVTATAFVGDGSQLTNLPSGGGGAAVDLLEVMLFT